MVYKIRCVFVLPICLLVYANVMANQDILKHRISNAIEEIKTSEVPAVRIEFVSQLAGLIHEMNPEDIDDKTLNDIIDLLDIHEVRVEIAVLLRDLKLHAKKIIPKLLQALGEEKCKWNYVDMVFSTGYSSVDVIIASLQQLGVKHPVTADCNGNYSASDFSDDELKSAANKLKNLHVDTDRKMQTVSFDARHHNEIYSPDGIDLVYVERTGIGMEENKGFYIGMYEVTQEQWKVLMGNVPHSIDGDNLPVDYVNRNDVQEFLLRLNTATGRNYRLPTEAEWDFAARGGIVNSYCQGGCKYSGSNIIDDVAWYHSVDRRPYPVGTKQPNEIGVYDMSGNVWEWCEERHESMSSVRIIRGCGWSTGFAELCRIEFRHVANPNNRYRALGFRVVLP